MSYTWREMVKRKKKELKERLNLSQEEWDFIQNNIGEFCRESDEQVRLIYGDRCDVDKEVAGMTESRWMEMTEAVIRDVLARLKFKKKKKKKQKVAEKESEKTEEDKANEEEQEQEQEAEIENK